MSQEVKVPTVGESITEVTIAEWVKKDGDYVEMDEIIAELESDKATFELNAPHAGVLQTRASEGDTLEIGTIICEIDPDGETPTVRPKRLKLKINRLKRNVLPTMRKTLNLLKKNQNRQQVKPSQPVRW